MPTVERRRSNMVDLILDERDRQDNEWGEQDHPDLDWLAILTEELGEVAKEVKGNQVPLGGNDEQMGQELVQVAAVALAWLECMERKYE